MVLPGAPTVHGAPHASVVAIDQTVADPRQGMVIGVGLDVTVSDTSTHSGDNPQLYIGQTVAG